MCSLPQRIICSNACFSFSESILSLYRSFNLCLLFKMQCIDAYSLSEIFYTYEWISDVYHHHHSHRCYHPWLRILLLYEESIQKCLLPEVSVYVCDTIEFMFISKYKSNNIALVCFESDGNGLRQQHQHQHQHQRQNTHHVYTLCYHRYHYRCSLLFGSGVVLCLVDSVQLGAFCVHALHLISYLCAASELRQSSYNAKSITKT